MTKVFEYGQRETDHLKASDPILGEAIDRIGKIEREVTPDPFTALIGNIVSQQVSKAAAATIWKRLCDLLTGITPEAIVGADVEDIQKCGMTMRKADNIKGIGRAVHEGDLDFDALYAMTDQEIVKKLITLKGIGLWTAEMLLIFSLQRPDVVSYGDLAIRRGMMNLYELDNLSKSEFEKYRCKYSPYGTVASLYLWELSRQ